MQKPESRQLLQQQQRRLQANPGQCFSRTQVTGLTFQAIHMVEHVGWRNIPVQLTDESVLDIGASTTTDNTPENNSGSSTRTSFNPLASILGYEYAFTLLHLHLPRHAFHDCSH